MSRLLTTAIASTFAVVFATSAAIAHEPSQAELLSQATVSEATAQATALAKVPSGKIASSELETEHNRLIWSFDITQAGTSNTTEIQVDAKSGKIVSTQIEAPGKEAAEAAAEAKEKGK